PTARVGAIGAVLNGKLYAIGGNNGGGLTFNLVEVYDPASNTWTTDSPMPTLRSGCAASVVGGVIYVAGGGNTNTLATLEAFTPSSAPTFQAATYWGAAADQRGTGIKYAGGALYISGNNSASSGIISRYATPLAGGATPVWSTNWPSLNTSDN